VQRGFDACLRYALDGHVASEATFELAHSVLLDTLGRGLEALQHAECTRWLGPIVPGALMPGGARLPGTSYEFDPVHTAFNLGVLFAWGQDHGVAWHDDESASPSASLAAVLALADYRSRRAIIEARPSSTVRELSSTWIKAFELQQCLAQSAEDVDPCRAIRVASALVAVQLLGGTEGQLAYAAWCAWHERGAPHHGTRTGWKRCWAAGDAASRGLRHALVAMCQYAMPLETTLDKRALDDCAALDVEAARLPLGSRAFDDLRSRVVDGASLQQLLQRFEASVVAHYPARQADRILTACRERTSLEALPVHEFVALFVRN
jgi:2-methylcitrate dehydratase PrpD